MIYNLIMMFESFGFYNDFRMFFDYYYSDFASNYSVEAVDYLSAWFNGFVTIFLAFFTLYLFYKVIFVVGRWFVKW